MVLLGTQYNLRRSASTLAVFHSMVELLHQGPYWLTLRLPCSYIRSTHWRWLASPGCLAAEYCCCSAPAKPQAAAAGRPVTAEVAHTLSCTAIHCLLLFCSSMESAIGHDRLLHKRGMLSIAGSSFYVWSGPLTICCCCVATSCLNCSSTFITKSMIHFVFWASLCSSMYTYEWWASCRFEGARHSTTADRPTYCVCWCSEPLDQVQGPDTLPVSG